MAKVLIVTTHPRGVNLPIVGQVLRNLGIQYEIAYADAPTQDVRTPAGAFAPSSADLRNYFRQFDAVFVLRTNHIAENFSPLAAAAHWLSWNAPEDPPVVYAAWHFGVSVTALPSLPSDFPLIRMDASDPSTYTAADEGAALIFFFSIQRHGMTTRLHREGVNVTAPAFCSYDNPTGSIRLYWWRYNPTLHSTLASQSYTHAVAANGRAGEILATPAASPPDDGNYPNNTVVAYRYYNRFFVPYIVGPDHASRNQLIESTNLYGGLFWLLYALKLCGVRASHPVPIVLETDHPLEVHPNGPTALTRVQKLTILRDTFDYLRHTCKAIGLSLPNGWLNARDRFSTRTAYPWYLLFSSPQEEREIAQQVLQILIAGHKEGALPCGVHDHTFGDGHGYGHRRIVSSFTRHSDTGSLYGAPNDVPIQHGRCCVAKHVAPSSVPLGAIETTIGDDTILEWDFAGRMSGVGATLSSLDIQNVHTARMIIEGELLEMQQLGFPDGHCGEHRYTNTANNNAGGIAYWQAARELGLRALRTSYGCTQNAANPNAPGSFNQVIPPTGRWQGFHLIPHISIDVAGNCWGLYHPTSGSSTHAVGAWGLDSAANDITGQWSTNRHTAAWRAHRRALSRLTAIAISLAALNLGTTWWHPYGAWYGCSPSQPVARFDGANLLNAAGEPHWNPTVELIENLRVIVSVLSNYLKFGSVSDLIVVRERVFA